MFTQNTSSIHGDNLAVFSNAKSPIARTPKPPKINDMSVCVTYCHV